MVSRTALGHRVEVAPLRQAGPEHQDAVVLLVGALAVGVDRAEDREAVSAISIAGCMVSTAASTASRS